MRWWPRPGPVWERCAACEHSWQEHAGSGAHDPDDADGDACEECDYEVAHGERGQGDLCRLRAYHSRVQALLAVAYEGLGALGQVVWVPPSPLTRTARVEVELPEGRSVSLFEDDDAVKAVVVHRVELTLDAGEEKALGEDPLSALARALVRCEPSAVDARDQVQRWWREHLAAPFPQRLREDLVAGVDMVVLDAAIAGYVMAWLGGERQGGESVQPLRRLMVEADVALSHLVEPDEVVYVRRLRQMAAAIIEAT